MTADQPRADAIAALRMRLRAVRGYPYGARGTDTTSKWAPDPDGAYVGAEDAWDLIVAALAPADPTADLRAAVDVDLLTEAEWTVDQGNWFIEKSDAQEWAKEVAAEYARLLSALAPADPTADLRAAARDLYVALRGEHGHDEQHTADWPSCLSVHIAMNRYRAASTTEDET